MEKKSTGVVAYCDGGSIPGLGFSGCGIHGFLYHYPTEKEKPTKAGAWHLTDKGYLTQHDIEETKATPIVVDQVFDIYYSFLEGTNNKAEILAIEKLFHHLNEYSLLDGIEKLHIKSDSKLVVKGISEWIPIWKNNGWKKSDGGDVANVSEWKCSYDAVENYRKQGEFSIERIDGHTGQFGNTRADYLATYATNLAAHHILQERLILNDPSSVYRSKSKLHPFIGLKRVYFNTDPEFNCPGFYYQTNGSGKDFVLGKRSSEAGFSVVSMKYPDPVIETVIRAACKRQTIVNTILYMKTERIRDTEIIDFLTELGEHCLLPDKRNLNMNFLDRHPVVVEVLPGELPLRAVDIFTHLEEILIEFRDNYLITGILFNNSMDYQVHDITSHFYDLKTKRSGKDEVPYQELKKEFGVGHSKTKISLLHQHQGKEFAAEIILSFGEDLPERNTMKQIEQLNPVVYVVTWNEGLQCKRYAVVIQTEDALGIWSNAFANLILFPK